MPVTLTIKQVPDRVARQLRERARANHRSLQGELMAVLAATLGTPAAGVEQPQATYRSARPGKARPPEVPPHRRNLTLAELWQMGRAADLKSRNDSTRTIRRMRDERRGS